MNNSLYEILIADECYTYSSGHTVDIYTKSGVINYLYLKSISLLFIDLCLRICLGPNYGNTYSALYTYQAILIRTLRSGFNGCS